MKVDYLIITCALLVFTLCLISTVTIVQIPETALRAQFFLPLMLLLATGVALVVLFGVIIATKGALTKSMQKS